MIVDFHHLTGDNQEPIANHTTNRGEIAQALITGNAAVVIRAGGKVPISPLQSRHANIIASGNTQLRIEWEKKREGAFSLMTEPRLSPLIRLGTSTWTYEGWLGQVYKKTYPKSRFKQDCLAEYARYEYEGEPLFRTVGIDHTFYGPPTPQMLAHYAAQLPTGFQACAKVWEETTVPVFPSGLRYAKKAGPNRYFLDATYFTEMVLAPFDQAFKEHAGPFILEFQRSGLDPDTFLRKLDQFLEKVPKKYEYAIEVRNPAIIGQRYHAVLLAHGASHIYNYLYAMPSLEAQHEKLDETFTAPFVLFRLLTPRDKKYHDAVKAYRPYDKLVHPLPDMRKKTVELVKQAVMEGRRAYVLVNNRAEGNAPETAQSLYASLR